MSTKQRGKRSLVVSGFLLLMILAVTVWSSWDHVRFWRLFEPLGRNEQGYPEYRHRQAGIVFVRVPGGTFSMGSSKDEQGSQPNERPQHEVRLDAFLIAKYEVNQREWEKVMRSSPSRFKGDDFPVERVSWEDCQEFCKETDLSLPTEAQWEYACRAGSNGRFAGTGRLDDMGWYKDNSGSTTHAVGQKQPTAFGLYDMHGNVWEWCEDAFDEFSSGYRVIRGGSWFVVAQHCRSAFRYGDPPSNQSIAMSPRAKGKRISVVSGVILLTVLMINEETQGRWRPLWRRAKVILASQDRQGGEGETQSRLAAHRRTGECTHRSRPLSPRAP